MFNFCGIILYNENLNNKILIMKILFFNLELLEAVTAGDTTFLVEALRKLSLGRVIPRNTFEKHKPIDGLAQGTSFLLNAADLFKDNTDVVYKAQYIKLAGRRDFASYKILGSKNLDLSFFPDIDLRAIKSNKLLDITSKSITFKYE